MGFIGGTQQQSFVGRIRDREREQMLAVPIDVGKRTAAALVCDFWGELVGEPFEFGLNEHGFTALSTEIARASAARNATWVRVGVEQAGHYHQTLIARLQADSYTSSCSTPSRSKRTAPRI
ncbi:hypothetical protein BH20ACT21_BH20ACT21_13040 [soil metagenome]